MRRSLTGSTEKGKRNKFDNISRQVKKGKTVLMMDYAHYLTRNLYTQRWLYALSGNKVIDGQWGLLGESGKY